MRRSLSETNWTGPLYFNEYLFFLQEEDPMDVERFLREYPTLGMEILRLNRELNNTIMCKNESYNTLQAQTLTDMPKNRTPEEIQSSVEKAVIRIADKFDEQVSYYTNRINSLIEQQKLFEAIWAEQNLLMSTERRIIELRYFYDYSWERICRTMYYSRSQASAILRAALEKMQQRIESTAS